MFFMIIRLFQAKDKNIIEFGKHYPKGHFGHLSPVLSEVEASVFLQ